MLCVCRRRKRRKAGRRSTVGSLGVRASRSRRWASASGRWCATRRKTGSDWLTSWRTRSAKTSEPYTLCSPRTSCRRYPGSSRRRSDCSGESCPSQIILRQINTLILSDFPDLELNLINRYSQTTHVQSRGTTTHIYSFNGVWTDP